MPHQRGTQDVYSTTDHTDSTATDALSDKTISNTICYRKMESFNIQITISDRQMDLLVFPDRDSLIFEIYEDKNRLGVIYKDLENDGCWCSDEPIPVELVNLIGKKIDAYEG